MFGMVLSVENVVKMLVHAHQSEYSHIYLTIVHDVYPLVDHANRTKTKTQFFKYSKVSIYEHLYNKGTSLIWALGGTTDRFLLEVNLFNKGTSHL
jgi:hypothetical protein